MEFLQEFLDNAKFFGQNESIRRLKTWIKRHFDDYFELIDFFELYHPDDCSDNDKLIKRHFDDYFELIDFFELYYLDDCSDNDNLIYFGVQFKNPYLAARVVGRLSFMIDLH